MSPEAYRINLHLSNVALHTEARYFTQPNNREQLRASLELNLVNPGFRGWWEAFLPTLDPEFAAFVQEIIDYFEAR